MTRYVNSSTLLWLCAWLPVVMGCGILGACGDAQPISSADALATRRYVEARSELIRATVSALPIIRLSGKGFLTKIADECPGIALQAPRNSSFDVVSIEATRALAVAMRQANHRTIEKFARTIAALKWTDPRLTILVHSQAVEAEAMTKVGAPDLCGNLREWSRGRYQTIPHRTLRFNESIAALGAVEARGRRVAVGWWREHLPKNERGLCRRYRRGHHHGFITVCSGGPAEPSAIVREGQLITEAKSTDEAIWKLLVRYESSGTHSLTQDVQQREAPVRVDLEGAYWKGLARLSQMVGVHPILLPEELRLLGLP
jgi:hypothetical protein